MKGMIILIVCLCSLFCFAILTAQQQQSIGQQFHQKTSFSDKGFKGQLFFGDKGPLYKKYDNGNKYKFNSATSLNILLQEVIEKRKSIRNFGNDPLTFNQLSALLLAADGITHSSNGHKMRSAPSGGALYPIEIYVIIENVKDIKKGLYHFQVFDSSLSLIKEGDFNQTIHIASNNQNSVGKSPVTLILTSRFNQSTSKYADRGYRYCYIEAGAISQNVYLSVTALKLGTVVVGAFNDDYLNSFLGIDGIREAALLIMPIGYPQ